MAENVTPARRGFLDFSPGKKDKENKENHLPVLSLIQFSKPPFVSFGLVKLGTSKSALLRIENPTQDAPAEVTVDRLSSSKGFSVDHKTFTIQPEGSFILTVTWTPTDEGGARELIIFNANGVLKHQAVLLGRAEAQKKKKKSLWDKIKNKRDGEKLPRQKNPQTPLKMKASKTIQVSRNQQYKRDNSRSPLASINEGVAPGEGDLSKLGQVENEMSRKTLHPYALSVQENVAHEQNSPVVLLVPAGKLMGCGNPPVSPDALLDKPGNKNLIKVLNRTLSPIGTPERLKTLMPFIQTIESPIPTEEQVCLEPLVLSVSDALTLIGSDLGTLNSSPRDTSSCCSFSDSLESKSGSKRCTRDKYMLKAIPVSPKQSETNEPRLTFFVRKSGLSNVEAASEVDEPVQKGKKTTFTSATVTKCRAAEDVNRSNGRKIKKSRRRLLENTLELCDGSSQSDSGPGTPGLPVIDVDLRTKRVQNSETFGSPCDAGHRAQESSSCCSMAGLDVSLPPAAFPVTSSPSAGPGPLTLPSATPPLAVHTVMFTLTAPPPLDPPFPQQKPSNSNACGPNARVSPPVLASSPTSEQQNLFPVHLVIKNKKRKSEEYMRSDGKTEDVGKTARVKRSRVQAGRTGPNRSAQERRVSQKHQQKTAGSIRSVSALSSKSSVPAQAKQLGSKHSSRGGQPPKSCGTPSVRTVKIVAVAQSKLTFVKPTQTAIPRHPMPFAAKNMFYDERWIEKQERGFTWWINYVLTPDDFKVSTEVTKVSAMSLVTGSDSKFEVPKAPTKEEMSFSTYTARCKLNRLRRSACQLFTSEAMAKAIQRLELEVEAKRLLVRKDRHLWKDIGERQKILNWLLSYNPLWLRIGLETIFGELISLESNSDAMGLAVFILQRLLWNPDIAAEFRHPKVPHLYREGHEEALSRFTLKKLILLVCFLDKAKESRLIEHNPCLFCMDAEFKTSKDLLLAFARDFLSGEGILPRHLSYLGLPVSHVQTPLDEFNFAVKNLAVDLKCGIRLVRVLEVLIQDWSLSSKLRLPTISRLQKVHNVDVVLQVLRHKAVSLKDEHGCIIDSRDIVDGHREKTLSLLWKVIFTFHVDVILDEHQLREEIGFLKRSLRIKRRLAALKADRVIQPSPAKTTVLYEHSSVKMTLLMGWARAVCAFYNLQVENFTVAFSDGRVLCYLIHHYHPGLLPEHDISHSTTQTVECSPRGRLELNCSSSDSDVSFDSLPKGQNETESPALQFKELLDNESNNFRLVNTAVAFLGGVPAMINVADMSNTIPNEKVVMSYLSFLCVRLLDLRNETRAARIIQGAWRKYRLMKDLQLYQERNTAALKIQLAVRKFLQRRRAKRKIWALITIQSFWRGYMVRKALRLNREAKLRALQHSAATVIQANWRMFLALRAYQRLRYYAIVVQAQWRLRMSAAAYGKVRRAAVVFQRRLRALAHARRQREHYLALRNAVVKIQRGYRRWKSRKAAVENRAARVIQAVIQKWYRQKMTTKHSAAVRIQSWYKMQKHRHQYRKLKRSTVLVQARCRGCVQRRRFELMKLQQRSAVVIQSAFRGHAVRKQVAQMKRAAVIIQQWFRESVKTHTERRAFVQMRCAAITIQAAYRGKVARELLAGRHKAATLIQAAFRRFATRRHFLAVRKSAAVIQEVYRATLLARKTKQEYDALRNAAVSVQACWRGRASRKRIRKWHECATLIQACYHKHKVQAEYRSKRAAAIILQCHLRAYVAGKVVRKEFVQMKAACVVLQAGFRGTRVRIELKKKRQAAIRIQSKVRMFLCRKQYFLLQSAAIIIQCRYRALLVSRMQHDEYRRLKQAAIKIQAAYRGVRARQELQKRHNAATVIQAGFRMHRMRMAYLAAKCAALIIQQHYWARKLGDQQRQRYKTMKCAAVIIQAAYRGYRVRKEVAQMHTAATLIQRRFLAIQERKRFQALKAAALVCQQRYRAKTTRLGYLLKRRAVTRLQAAYRGYEVRKQLRVERTAAVTIQSHFRKYQQRTHYMRLRWAAGVLQTHYRAQRQARDEMKAFSAKRHAAVVLQAAFRGMKCRRIMRMRRHAAFVIQRTYRAHCQRKRYLVLRSSVLNIQRRYRASVAAKVQKKQYMQVRRATIVLQAAFRSQQVRKEVACWHRAATVIQSAFRKHREEVKFQAMRCSAVIIQRFYRVCVLQRQEREKFLKAKHSAVVLQAAFRGHHVRRNIAKMHRAASVIQANFKMHKALSVYRRLHWAACVLQRRFRAQTQRNMELKKYQHVRKAVIKLQAAYCGMKTRQNIKKHHQAAAVIQRAYRAHCQRKRYLILRSSVLNIQRRYRASVAAKVQKKQYLQVRRATIVLQAAFRGLQVRKEVAHWRRAATVIQLAFRKHREEVKFQAMRCSAIIIQRFYRACVLQRQEREKFLKAKHSAVVLQAAFRGHHVRRNIAKMHRAASVIQANFKMHKALSVYRRLHWAACVLQRRFTAQTQRNMELKKYQHVRKAVIKLQAAYRGMKTRQNIKKHHQAAAVIQRAYRAHCQCKRYLVLRSSVLNIQRRYRASVAAKVQKKQYLQVRRATIVLQAAFRGLQVRKEVARWHRAATVIQSAFRKHREEVKFQAMRCSAVIIQRFYRACVLQRQEREKFLKAKHSAVVLQAAFRGHHVRRNIAKMHRAASVIQANFKMHKALSVYRRLHWAACVLQRRFTAQTQRNMELKKYQRVRKAVIKLQAAYRGMKTRQNIKKHHQAAAVIQRAYRAHCQCKRYLVLRSSVLNIQRRYRASVAAKVQKKLYLQVRRATIVLQVAFRGQHVRKEVARWHRAATVIQSAFRKHREEVKFQAMRCSAVIIQRFYRACVLQRQERRKFLKAKHSAVILQAAFRSWQVRRQLGQQHRAATLIQSHWRCWVQRRTFERMRWAAVTLQRRVQALQLGRMERHKYTRLRQAAIILQTHWRAWIPKQQVLEAVKAERRCHFTAAALHHLSAIRIQRALRGHWILEAAKKRLHFVVTIQRWVRMRQQRRLYLEERAKVMMVQRAVRRWLTRRHKAARVIQQAARKFLHIRRQKRIERGIIKAQALWRGHRARLLNDNPKVVKLRHHLRKVSAGARDEDKLCNKTSAALSYLLCYKHFSYIIEALKNLETATRLSPECCERLVESGATNVIFTLIRSCNRSGPSMEVITHSIQVLLNLSKYHRTIQAVYSVENSVETLLDLLQRYREKAGNKVAEKGGSIFTKTCFLLALLLQDKERAEEVTNMPKALDRIRSIYRLTVRKQKMDTERSVMMQKINASINGNFSVHATSRKSRPAPKFAPEWVLRKDNIKDIVDPLRAIEMVVGFLEIKL
ncbi:abnormal spindle-like microcephaly-associated protein [Thalassophryne amazonica]|uniref:abnormal spindle-like microcephaly-associated protein n=1 Tax=Thalassophryne amazonica TaxID=390379 RepID=UPI001471CCE3|nr:abnormal spindle-like microcephaly-associated protein [Thalassophryne amazonica]